MPRGAPTASATSYTLTMSKCEPDCTCKRHYKVGTPCPTGCTCARHVIGEERRQRISAAKTGKPLSPRHRSALKCLDGCTCAKHDLRNSGQFQSGSLGAFAGRRHTEETRAKLAEYTGERASSYRHGWSRTPTYRSWNSMLSRCRDESNASWPLYGARGISVCERWKSFENFLEDMGARPSLDYQIDRRDPDGNYEPTNCRWLTRAENNARRRDPGGWTIRRRRQQL